MNDSGITPLGDRCVLKVHKVDDKTKGGIILPDDYVEKKNMAQLKATLLENGETADQRLGFWPEPGDVVLITKYAGTVHQTEDGDEYRVVSCEDILGVMKDG